MTGPGHTGFSEDDSVAVVTTSFAATPDPRLEQIMTSPVVESPRREPGADISFDHNGDPCVFSGRVRSSDGTPLPGARVDVWQASGAGYSDVQQPDVQPERNLRGLFVANPAPVTDPVLRRLLTNALVGTAPTAHPSA